MWFVLAFFVAVYVVVANIRGGSIRLAMVTADRSIEPAKFWMLISAEIAIAALVLVTVAILQD